ncbi:hypothetical protein JOF56_003081 [Kibdelosporangium banguiense]|uniref:Lipopolysaccharide assembly protein A domain-containing protein n=1 Tax=Kibdelosporangium banguiense TaxID=1365924 RepID=A0ABS4TE51_9PSEU|nr:hypothetical protein [Kibdelosporangium banguiense]MBP2322696.1 hypothetical protein [Kibdelosporangium banguiense]
MRNRVAGGRTRSLVTAGLVTLLMLGTGQLAFAQDSTTRLPFNVAGPVGIAVAAIGLSGMLLGLWRFSRKLAKAKAADTAVIPVVEPAAPVAQPVTEPRTPARTP